MIKKIVSITTLGLLNSVMIANTYAVDLNADMGTGTTSLDNTSIASISPTTNTGLSTSDIAGSGSTNTGSGNTTSLVTTSTGTGSSNSFTDTTTDTTNLQTFSVVNNAGTIEVTKDTIFVGSVDKNTSIIDLFKSVNIDGKDVSEDVMKNLDVRYVNPEKVDFKISADTDIIDANSTVYILFKTQENGGVITNNSTVKFELKNLLLKEIGTVSQTAENSYNKIYNVEYKTEDVIPEGDSTTVAPISDQPVVENTVLEQNNTGIKDHILLIVLSLFALLGLLIMPTRKGFNKV